MSWIHDTGYGSALDHEGGVADVLEADTDTSTPPDQIDPRVTGWRAGCQCGWQRNAVPSLRSEWPRTEYARAPGAVEQQCRGEWERHLHVVLPGLAVHDRRRRITQAHDGLLQAVAAARAAGIPWKDVRHAAAPRPRRSAGLRELVRRRHLIRVPRNDQDSDVLIAPCSGRSTSLFRCALAAPPT